MKEARGALRLHSGAPFWLVNAGLVEMSTPAPASADVAIIGAGITGALLADALTAAGLSVVVVDRRAPATGSTAASTALLQYEIDRELHELIDMVGEVRAVRAYRLCADAIDELEGICRRLPDDCGFVRRSSLYIASRRRHAHRLDLECDTRRRHGFEVTRLSRREIAARYGFPGHGALLTPHAAVVDPVRLTRALLQRMIARGGSLLSRTTVLDVSPGAAGLAITTDSGSIQAGQVIYAMGYEVPPGLRNELVKLNSSFALATEPVSHRGDWDDDCLVWETNRPYTYMRTTADHRIVAGGVDIPFRGAELRDRMLPDRTRRLEHRLRSMLPGVEFETAFSWASTFGETRDGLPYIGPNPYLRRSYFALGYGGNGITFSVVAARILRDLCLGRPSDDAAVFRLER